MLIVFDYILILWLLEKPGVQFSSVTQSCPTLCDPMNHSMPGLPVHHQFLEFTQTYVYWVGDAIQPSHLLSPLLLLPSIFPSIRVFSNESALHIKWPKYWSFSFNIIFPMNCILLISNQFSPLFFSITQIQSSSLAVGNSLVASTNSSLESSICQQWTAGLGLSSSLNS